MKRYSTTFLKIAVFLIGSPVLILCIYVGMKLVNNPVSQDYAHIVYPMIAGAYVSAVPFYLALYEAFRLLCYIDRNTAFSQLSVNALKNIKRCASVFGIVYVVVLPFVCLFADKEDAPGIIFLGLIPVVAGMVIAVFAAVLQRLLQDAIDIKSENDLTV